MRNSNYRGRNSRLPETRPPRNPNRGQPESGDCRKSGRSGALAAGLRKLGESRLSWLTGRRLPIPLLEPDTAGLPAPQQCVPNRFEMWTTIAAVQRGQKRPCAMRDVLPFSLRPTRTTLCLFGDKCSPILARVPIHSVSIKPKCPKQLSLSSSNFTQGALTRKTGRKIESRFGWLSVETRRRFE